MRLNQRFVAFGIFVVACLVMTGRAGAEDFPKGTFTIKHPSGGDISITFDGKSKVTVKANGEEMVQCDYKVTKDQVEFSNETGPKGNADAKPGTYKWKVDGKKLTFTKVTDESEGRAQALTFGTWEKKE